MDDEGAEFANLAMQANEFLPQSWNPRREQPERDRYFTGRADFLWNFNHHTERAITWYAEALAFSQIILGGFDTAKGGIDLPYIGRVAREHIAKGKNQGLDTEFPSND